MLSIKLSNKAVPKHCSDPQALLVYVAMCDSHCWLKMFHRSLMKLMFLYFINFVNSNDILVSGVVNESNDRYLYCLNVFLCTKKQKETKGNFVFFVLSLVLISIGSH